jgi:ArsR family transcriptional regulator, arsenate/arsenite/antimonite-responsive transcriptional repressor
MEIEQLANCLEKLGNTTRLEVFRLLVQAGPAGLAVGELQSRLGVPASTLSHHILFLATAGLIRQEREGRMLKCQPNLALMRTIVRALTAECCKGVPSREDKKLSPNGGRRRVARRRRANA